ncbi:unnamed protein product [Ixodes persulcatus]
MAGRSEAVLLSLLLLLVPSQSRNTGLHPGSVVILNPTGAPLPTDIPVRDSSETPNIPAKDQTGAGSTEASASSTFANVATEDSPGNVPTNLPADVPTSLPTKLATDVAKTEQYNLDKNETGSFTSRVPESSPMSTYPPSTSRQEEIFNDQTTILSTDAVTVTPTDRSSTAAATDTSPTPEDPKGPSCAALDLPRWRPVPKTHRLRLSRANAACAPSCDSNRTRDEAPGATLSLSIQNIDEIQLDLDPSMDWWPGNKNGSVASRGTELRLALQSLQQGAAGQPCTLDDSLLLWNKAYVVPGLTVGPEILTPGSHALSLHLSGSEPGCSGQAAWLLNVSVHARECSKSPQDSDTCSGGGACVLEPGQTSFSCRCCPGLRNRFCEERDGCFTRPCRNGGYCVDIAEGLTGTMFQCLCLRGFRGRRCEERLSPCETLSCPQGTHCVPSSNGSRTCEDDVTPPPSAAASGVPDIPTTGTVPVAPKPDAVPETRMPPAPPVLASATSSSPVSSSSAGACAGRPCVHGMCEERRRDTDLLVVGGTDEDPGSTFKCYCLPGYGGDLCEFEYDECDSGPCSHGAQCEDLVAGFRCHCGPGYAGRACEIKVDLCRPDPCPPPAQCVDRGNNYSCLCHPGYDGPGCTQRYDPCFPNPCQNGGSCWPSLDSFYCSCARGFSGDTCDTLLPFMAAAAAPHDKQTPGALPRRGTPDMAASGRSGPVDQLHNIYIAAATLAGACLIVLAVVTVCHCRVHHSYRGCVRRLGRSCAQLKQHTLPRQILAEPAWERF